MSAASDPPSRDGGGAPSCNHCGLPLKGVRHEGPAWCCSGCAVVDGLLVGGGDGRTGSDPLLARVALSAFLSMGVMVASLSLYGQGWVEPEAAGAEDAAALRGMVRSAALLLTLPILHLLLVPLAQALIRTRRFLSLDLLVLVGVLAAVGVSAWNTVVGAGEVYFESASMVLTFVGLGRWMDVRAKEQARSHVRELADRESREVQRWTGAGTWEVARLEDVQAGDVLRVLPGEVIPVDGTILTGSALLDTSSLTGESQPRGHAPGANVLAGSAVLDAPLEVRADRVGAGRVREEVERMLSAALERQARPIALADRAARWLLPIAGGVAFAAGLWHTQREGLEQGAMVALSVLVVACPCALGIATPLAWWTALGEAWRRGVLVRGGDVFERLAQVERVFLDKTGTLTEPTPHLVRIEAQDAEAALRLAGALEVASLHPIARALLASLPEGVELPVMEDLEVVPGVGVRGSHAGVRYQLGRPAEEAPHQAATLVDLLGDGRFLARFHLEGRVTARARAAVGEFQQLGLSPVVLTGDGPGPAHALELELGVPVVSRLLPTQKVERLAPHRHTLFVGDGLNDAGAIAAADVGVAVSGSAPRSSSLADVLLIHADLGEVPWLLGVSRWAVQQARRNVLWTVLYNAVALAFAARGDLHPAVAALLMVLSSATVVALTRLGWRSREGSSGTRNDGAAPGVSAGGLPAAGSI